MNQLFLQITSGNHTHKWQCKIRYGKTIKSILHDSRCFPYQSRHRVHDTFPVKSIPQLSSASPRIQIIKVNEEGYGEGGHGAEEYIYILG